MTADFDRRLAAARAKNAAEPFTPPPPMRPLESADWIGAMTGFTFCCLLAAALIEFLPDFAPGFAAALGCGQ